MKSYNGESAMQSAFSDRSAQASHSSYMLEQYSLGSSPVMVPLPTPSQSEHTDVQLVHPFASNKLHERPSFKSDQQVMSSHIAVEQTSEVVVDVVELLVLVVDDDVEVVLLVVDDVDEEVLVVPPPVKRRRTAEASLADANALDIASAGKGSMAASACGTTNRK